MQACCLLWLFVRLNLVGWYLIIFQVCLGLHFSYFCCLFLSMNSLIMALGFSCFLGGEGLKIERKQLAMFWPFDLAIHLGAVCLPEISRWKPGLVGVIENFPKLCLCFWGRGKMRWGSRLCSRFCFHQFPFTMDRKSVKKLNLWASR